MKKLFLTMLIIGSCAFANVQEVKAEEPSFTATTGYADEILIRGLSYGGDGFLAGISGKFPTKGFTINAGAYHLLASEEDTQSHFHIGLGKDWSIGDIGLNTSGGISSHQIADPGIDSSVAVGGTVKLTEDPLGITNWVTPSVSLWKDVDYGFTGATWGLAKTLEVPALSKDWKITPSLKWGIGDEYDYTQVGVGISTDVTVFGTTLAPELRITHLDNDVDIPALEADKQTSVWFGVKYAF
tara:strand:+ start:403 stop:1125 length:723 start_codon:yes stop_codon:yes gene_type:complete